MIKDKAYWNFKKKQAKERIKEYKKVIFSSNTFFRISLTILFTAIFLVLFFACGGTLYFYDTIVVDEFRGQDFQIHAIDVEQGDSTLIKLPNNQTMLIDAGERDMGEHVTAYVKNFLDGEGLEKLDYLVLTHPDSDHIGGAIDVLENIEVDTVFRPKVYTQEEAENMSGQISVSTTSTYAELISLIDEKQCNEVFSDNSISFYAGGCLIEFLSPAEDYYSESNEFSAVIMLTYQTKKFLFMGDADQTIEQSLIDRYGDYLKADILKVGHHGSNTSSSQQFLEVVDADYALLYSDSNKDLPSSDVLNRLHSMGSEILRTSNLGDYALSILNDEIAYATASTPTIDIALLISIYTLLVIITWGIREKHEYRVKKRRVPDKTLQE